MATCDLCYSPCEYGFKPYCSNPACKFHDPSVQLRLGTPDPKLSADERYLRAHGHALIDDGPGLSWKCDAEKVQARGNVTLDKVKGAFSDLGKAADWTARAVERASKITLVLPEAVAGPDFQIRGDDEDNIFTIDGSSPMSLSPSEQSRAIGNTDPAVPFRHLYIRSPEQTDMMEKVDAMRDGVMELFKLNLDGSPTKSSLIWEGFKQAVKDGAEVKLANTVCFVENYDDPYNLVLIRFAGSSTNSWRDYRTLTVTRKKPNIQKAPRIGIGTVTGPVSEADYAAAEVKALIGEKEYMEEPLTFAVGDIVSFEGKCCRVASPRMSSLGQTGHFLQDGQGVDEYAAWAPLKKIQLAPAPGCTCGSCPILYSEG